MRKERPRLQIPTLEETAQVVWEVEALADCGDPEMAKRLTAARYWLETRRHGANGHRVIVPPHPEIPCEP
jgi:hypothetical protein